MKPIKRLQKGYAPTPRKLAGKRRKAPRGSFQIDPNGKIVEQARERSK